MQLDTANTKTFDEFVGQVKQSLQAFGRVGLPDDIGGALAKLTEGIASLLSEENRWVNAQRIEVSGGMYL